MTDRYRARTSAALIAQPHVQAEHALLDCPACAASALAAHALAVSTGSVQCCYDPTGPHCATYRGPNPGDPAGVDPHWHEHMNAALDILARPVLRFVT